MRYLLIIIVALFGWALLDPQATIPVASPIACSLNGGTWSDGTTLLQAGCYERVNR